MSLPLFNRCTDQVDATVRYTRVTPVYQTTDVLRDAVAVMPARPIEGTGKIYAHEGYLFLNQPSEGIHIIDNTDPANPRPISFVNIPGNFDLVAQGDVLYADSYIDTVGPRHQQPAKRDSDQARGERVPPLQQLRLLSRRRTRHRDALAGRRSRSGV